MRTLTCENAIPLNDICRIQTIYCIIVVYYYYLSPCNHFYDRQHIKIYLVMRIYLKCSKQKQVCRIRRNLRECELWTIEHARAILWLAVRKDHRWLVTSYIKATTMRTAARCTCMRPHKIVCVNTNMYMCDNILFRQIYMATVFSTQIVSNVEYYCNVVQFSHVFNTCYLYYIVILKCENLEIQCIQYVYCIPCTVCMYIDKTQTKSIDIIWLFCYGEHRLNVFRHSFSSLFWPQPATY